MAGIIIFAIGMLFVCLLSIIDQLKLLRKELENLEAGLHISSVKILRMVGEDHARKSSKSSLGPLSS